MQSGDDDLARARRFARLRAMARGGVWPMFVEDPDAALLSWLRAYGPFRDRQDKSELVEPWRQRRLRKAKAEFPGQRVTRAKLRELARELGPGYS